MLALVPEQENKDGPLTAEEVTALTERLQAGEYLDEYLLPRLFRRPREAELTYASKEPRGEILAQTMAVPLQTVKHFGAADENGWTNKLVFGDNLQV